MLRDDIVLYSKLTGEDGWSVPILKVGAYLDGYYKAINDIKEIYENSDYPEDLEMNIDDYLKGVENE